MVQRVSLVRAAPLPSFRNLKPLRFRGGGALADVHDSGVLFAAGTPALATAVLFLLFALFSGGHKAAGAPSRHGAEGSGLLRTMVYGVCALLVVAALALSDDSVDIEEYAASVPERLALILGTEGTGISSDARGICDAIVRIPMRADVDSLNVAAASAVAFWALRA
jgi:hypothetical protein